MRRSVQPNWPRAMTCRFFASLKMFAMPAEGRTPPPPRQRLERLLPMAGFQLSIYGGFWVSTEAGFLTHDPKRQSLAAQFHSAENLAAMRGFEPRTTGNGTDDQEVGSLRHGLAYSATPIHHFPFAVLTSAAEHPTREDVLVTLEEDRWSGFIKREACRQI